MKFAVRHRTIGLRGCARVVRFDHAAFVPNGGAQ